MKLRKTIIATMVFGPAVLLSGCYVTSTGSSYSSYYPSRYYYSGYSSYPSSYYYSSYRYPSRYYSGYRYPSTYYYSSYRPRYYSNYSTVGFRGSYGSYNRGTWGHHGGWGYRGWGNRSGGWGHYGGGHGHRH